MSHCAHYSYLETDEKYADSSNLENLENLGQEMFDLKLMLILELREARFLQFYC